jgi:multidrug efflux pump subunit AcrA (membrane-fusion protein)
MKNLKKLSAVFMLTALFSVSFTSCIDNEVSPIVEEIYAAQADLIAAQTAVQQAEAEYFLAMAAAEQALAAQRQAMADHQIAETAADAARWEEQLRMMVAQNDAEIERLARVAAEAQARLDILLAQLAAQLAEQGAIEAQGYLNKYASHMNNVTNLTNTLNGKKDQLALNELLLTTYNDGTDTWNVSYDFLIEMYEEMLMEEEAKVVAAMAAKAALEEAMANPSAEEQMIADLEAQFAELEQELVELVVAKVTLDNMVAEKEAELNAATGFMQTVAGDNPSTPAVETTWESPYLIAKTLLGNWQTEYDNDMAAITAANANIAMYEAIIADYEGTEETLGLAVAAALERIGATEADNHPSSHAPGFGLLGDIEDKMAEITAKDTEISGLQTAVGTYGTAPMAGDTPRTGTTPQDLLWNADLALLDHQAAFALLTATYNTAVTNLASATTTFESVDHDQLIADAIQLVTDMGDELGDYQTAYDDAKIDFEADPNGVIWFDGTDSYGDPIFASDDVAGTGAVAFAEVLTWQQYSGDTDPDKWEPATWSTTYVDAIPADGSAGALSVFIDWHNKFSTDPYIWTGTKDDANRTFYIEVGSDDFSETTEDLLNWATNDLGVEMTETTHPFYTETMGVRTYAADDNSTAWSRLWTAQKGQSEAEYNKANALEIFQAAQDAYDAQKKLFDEGLITEGLLEDAVTAAEGVVTTAQGLVTTAQGEKSDLEDEKMALEDELGSNDYAMRATDGTELPISWDEHANDGLPVGSEMYDVRADGSWDSDDDGDVDALTAYAAWWNAQLAYDMHTATTLAQYQTMLATAQQTVADKTLEVAEDELFIAEYQADLDALQAQYDALLLTPEFAALKIAVKDAKEAAAANAARQAEIIAMHNAEFYATPSVGAKGSLDLVHDALAAAYEVDYATLMKAQQDIIDAAPLIIEDLKALIANTEVDKGDVERLIADLEAAIADLEARIAAEQALAEQYKALMDAALAS